MTDSTKYAGPDFDDFPVFEPGTVWLVGAGPGAPGLMSLLGAHGIGLADVIVHDALVNKKVLEWARPEAEIIYAGKRGGKPSPTQSDITLRLIELAKAGKRVLRLKGGDPFVFGRGGEECEALAREHIGFRIVPGISSGIGGLAYAGIPVTHRETNHSVIFLTGHDETGSVPHGVDWQAIATASPVIVMYMAVKHFPVIAQRLMDAGRDGADRVAFVSHAALPKQKVVESVLSEAADVIGRGEVETPAIIVIGPVSRYRKSLDWYVGALRENIIG